MLRENHASQPLPAISPHVTRRPHARWRILRIVLAILVLLGLDIGLWVYHDPELAPEAVDLARTVFGPGAVAQVESWVFQAQDGLRQARYQATGAANHAQWAAPPAAPPRARAAAAQPTASAGSAAARATSSHTSSPTIASDGAIVTWSPFVYTADGQPVLERALITPDPTRPYVETALVRIDMHVAQLHLVAGTQEPISAVHVPRPGVIPAADQRAGRLLAAFNGGFKAANGAFGMFVNGATLLPPVDGLATLAIYRDGHIKMGVWGGDMTATPTMVAYRQNCPLLLDGGTLTEQANSDDPALWGKTVKNKIATWRSGLGLSADGRYLIYAAGDGLTVPSLAQALATGGADRAMQLDINSWWTRFVTYVPSSAGNHLVAQKLLSDMVGNSRQFLAPDTRDFFYLTALGSQT
jgi:hypothetical protein